MAESLAEGEAVVGAGGDGQPRVLPVPAAVGLVRRRHPADLVHLRSPSATVGSSNLL